MAGCASDSSNVEKDNVEDNTTKITNAVKEVVDLCELDYQKCSAECKVTTIAQKRWKKMACEAKCKSLYGACRTKEMSIKGYKYTKEKTIQGYKYIKLKISE
jgi:hypothetical protein